MRRSGWFAVLAVVGTIGVLGAAAPVAAATSGAAATKSDVAPRGGGGDGGGKDDPCASTSGSAGSVSKSITVNGKTYASDPGHLTVNAGQTVSVTISWGSGVFQGTPESAWDCVYFGTPPSLGGKDVGVPYDTDEKPASADPFKTSFVVPSAWTGKTICDRGIVTGTKDGWDGWGDGSLTQMSNQFCLTVEPAAQLAETRVPALLAILALVLFGGAFLVFQRRRKPTLVPRS